jgi:non-reducing end alpha-L-arabinofuranosidase
VNLSDAPPPPTRSLNIRTPFTSRLTCCLAFAACSGGSAGSGGSTGSGGSAGSGGSTGSGVGGVTGSGTGGAAGRDGGTAAGGGAAGSTPSGGNGGSGGATAVNGPCDIFASGSTPCVAAHSTVRALYRSYAGSLYQVRRASDNTTKDIVVLSPGGFAGAATQDAFCTGTSCTIAIIYDQSGRGNHLTKAPGGERKTTSDDEANATALKLTIGGYAVYDVQILPGSGYRNNTTSGIATGDQPETEYMVTSGTFYNGGCCFDYGNAETDNRAGDSATMEAVYFGNNAQWGKGEGKGPWVIADLENGLYPGPSFTANPKATSQTSTYVTAMVIG